MLDQMMNRLAAQEDCGNIIRRIVSDVVALHGAEFGDLQLSHDGALLLVAQLNLPRFFLETFRRVVPTDGCACGRAIRLRKSVVINDVEEDPEYAPYREMAARTGYRGVQSTPLFSIGGIFIGVVSTLFKNPHEPTRIELSTLQRYAGFAADRLLALHSRESLAEVAQRMSAEMYGDGSGEEPGVTRSVYASASDEEIRALAERMTRKRLI